MNQHEGRVVHAGVECGWHTYTINERLLLIILIVIVIIPVTRYQGKHFDALFHFFPLLRTEKNRPMQQIVF